MTGEPPDGDRCRVGIGLSPDAEVSEGRTRMVRGRSPNERRPIPLRRRLVLSVVEDDEPAAGFTLPLRDGPYRGHGDADLACGRCGRLLVIGVSRNAFRRFFLPCPCGALNRAAV